MLDVGGCKYLVILWWGVTSQLKLLGATAIAYTS